MSKPSAEKYFDNAMPRMQQVQDMIDRGLVNADTLDCDDLYQKTERIVDIEAEIKELQAQRDEQRFNAPDVAELDRIEKRIAVLTEEKNKLMKSFPWDMPDRDWNFLRDRYDDLRRELNQSKADDYTNIRARMNTIQTVLRGDHSSEALRKAYQAAGLPDDEVANKIKSVPRQSSASKEQTKAQQQQVERIEKVRELMQGEIDSMAWPRDKQGHQGLLGFVWQKHKIAIKRIYGEVEYDTIRRKTTPAECRKLGLKPLPKG